MNLQSKIAIIGSGPVGNYLVIRLIELGFQNIVVFESGNIKTESVNLNMSKYHFITESGLPKGVHKVGGGGNKWFGRIGEFSNNDFETLNYLRNSQWPIDKLDLDSCYLKVREILGISKNTDDEVLNDFLTKNKLRIPKELTLQSFEFINPNVLKSKFLTLLKDGKFQILMNSFVENISLLSEQVIVNYKNENTFDNQMIFDSVFIACGTLQTTALLQRSANDIGIESGVLGKNLMEHFDLFIGKLLITARNDKELTKLILNRKRVIKNYKKNIGFAIKPADLIEKERSFIHISLEIVPKTVEYKYSKHIDTAGINVFTFAFTYSLYIIERVIYRLHRALRELLFYFNIGNMEYSLWLKGEELAYEESKCYLDKNKEDLLIYNHQISDRTFEELNRVLLYMKQLISEKNLGEIILRDIVNSKEKLKEAYANWHPMGTCRIGKDNRTSICDELLNIHGRSNIFVASAAVFPTGSNSNPTFTTLALVEFCLVRNFLFKRTSDAA